jgi:hypothetical protein
MQHVRLKLDVYMEREPLWHNCALPQGQRPSDQALANVPDMTRMKYDVVIFGREVLVNPTR